MKDEFITTFTRQKVANFQKGRKIKKRCAICKKPAKVRVRIRNLDNNTVMQDWKYLCLRHARQRADLIAKQSESFRIEE